MMKKRILALLACGAFAAGATAGLTACNNDKGITVWAPNTQQELVKSLVNEFLEANPDFKIPVTVGVCGENNAYAQMSVDVEASADVYGFANDQLMNLRNAGALARISSANVEKLKTENEAKAVDAGKITEDGTDYYYGYPYAADNGFFLYYDKSVVSEEDAKSIDTIIKACGRTHEFLFNMNDQPSWYLGSFFYGAGGDYTMEWDGSVLVSAGCNFDQKPQGVDYTYGQIAAQALIDLRAKTQFVSCNDTVISQELSEGRMAACITGTWNAKLIQEKLGDNYAVTKCPTFSSSLTGDVQYQMKPFIGYKLFGVNPYSKHLAEAHQLAAYLSSEAAQVRRFTECGIGPSNLNAQKSEDVKKDLALNALWSQNSFAKVQESLPDTYWTAFDTIGADIYGGQGSTTAADRDKYVSALISGLKVEN